MSEADLETLDGITPGTAAASKAVVLDASLDIATINSLTATTLIGDGASVTNVDAITGDSATAFFDAGTIEHEWGGLQADVSAYTGLIGITGADTTIEVDTFAEIDTAIADKALVNKADGAVWSGVHDFGGATSLEIPNGTDPDVTVAGQISQDTDAAGETGDESMRGYDGAAQFLFSKKVKHLTIVVSNPEDLTSWTGRANPGAVVWANKTGMSFTILEMYSVSDSDNYDFDLFESASLTDMSDAADDPIVSVNVDDNGTDCFTSTDAAINHVIEKDHALIFEHTLGSTNMVTMVISGWFNSDVAP